MIKEELLEVLSIQSYHFKQDLMVEYLKGKISEFGCNYEMHEGNIYVVKGKAEKYHCVVAHMDTVQEIVKPTISNCLQLCQNNQIY